MKLKTKDFTKQNCENERIRKILYFTQKLSKLNEIFMKQYALYLFRCHFVGKFQVIRIALSYRILDHLFQLLIINQTVNYKNCNFFFFKNDSKKLPSPSDYQFREILFILCKNQRNKTTKNQKIKK